MNKKRLLGAFLIITSLIVMLLPAAEADAETSASAFTIKSGELIKYKGVASTVSVPDTVTAIGEGAFEDNDYVEKIILPDAVKKIEAYAFWGCDNLETVILGNGLTEISDFAFANCDGLETMTITPNIKRIGIQAFADCNNFEDITIPFQVTDISEDAFDGDYLLNIHCETGSYADKYAQEFYERQKDMPVYEKPEDESIKVDAPEDGVYSGSGVSEEKEAGLIYEVNVQGDTLGSTTVVDNQAVVFIQNAGLPVQNEDKKPLDDVVEREEISKESGKVSSVGQDGVIVERTYYRNADVREAVVEDGVHTISQFAYARSGITEIILPDGLKEIEYAAFYHCDNLKDVIIPESVTAVAAKAFAHTEWVNDFLKQGNFDSVVEKSADEDFLISGGVLVAYRGNAKEVIVPEGVRVIAGEAFEDHTEIETVILPATVQNIDELAFDGCNPKKVEYNGDAMEEELVETRVSLNSLSQLPRTQSKSPFVWILATLMLVTGCACMLHKAK